MSLEIRIERSSLKRPRPRDDELGFGKFFTDHMFRVDYDVAQGGWRDARIVPYAPLSFDPAMSALHYGQLLFEGLKAFAAPGGGVRLFRPAKHAARLNATARRLCMPEIDGELLVEAMRRLIAVDRDWIPKSPGASVYVRPVMFATESFLGVRPSKTYTLLVILSPVGSYFKNAEPLRIRVETESARSVRGGTGATKMAGNYAGSLFAAERAKAEGHDQVLWLDGAERRWVDEIGMMNFFAKIGDKIVTPSLDGTILAGITRDSVITMLQDFGIPVEERKLAVEELVEAGRDATLMELFGTGTAAVVAPIAELRMDQHTVKPIGTAPGPIARRLQEEITAIQYGRAPDRFGWLVEV